jgi:hypothetical protein
MLPLLYAQNKISTENRTMAVAAIHEVVYMTSFWYPTYIDINVIWRVKIPFSVPGQRAHIYILYIQNIFLYLRRKYRAPYEHNFFSG